MKKGEYAFLLGVSDHGEWEVLNASGDQVEPLSPEELGKELQGREITKATVLPRVTILRSNPQWCCVGGNWYRC
ncbi:MAG: hypothetical protein N839_0014870 [Desulfofustis sp. PB-SRB1]|jgi:hypothetical protein|nr:hypothetical protein [Desulfofustis sp. PB-SRB1]MBM1003678.1 hypothetical protein [Desulfofustis sp. PB-SRB1]HBH30137.1 hypothetical protein [Desulfofustis sp.]HBH32561.1 hypothetical protein [Desulfofustis sp.]